MAEINRIRPLDTLRAYLWLTNLPEGSKVCLFDTETNGLLDGTPGEGPSCLQFCGIKYEVKDGALEESETLNLYMYPRDGEPLNDEAAAIHGLTMLVLQEKKAVEQSEGFRIIRDFLRGTVGIMAYNAPFDVGIMNLLFERNGAVFMPGTVLDVMAMFRDCVSMYKQQKIRLSDAAKYLKINPADYGDLHDAYTDIRVTFAVFKGLLEDYTKYAKHAEPLLQGNKVRVEAGGTPRVVTSSYRDTDTRLYMSVFKERGYLGSVNFNRFDRSFHLGSTSKPFPYRVEEVDLDVLIRTFIKTVDMAERNAALQAAEEAGASPAELTAIRRKHFCDTVEDVVHCGIWKRQA